MIGYRLSRILIICNIVLDEVCNWSFLCLNEDNNWYAQNEMEKGIAFLRFAAFRYFKTLSQFDLIPS